jgi:hypothetical protein
MSAGNLRRYAGKIIRLNLDGTIPSDNPVINGVRTHIWSYGHRNPQGLAFARDANNVLVPRGRLYSSEMALPRMMKSISLILQTTTAGPEFPASEMIIGTAITNGLEVYRPVAVRIPVNAR